MTKKSKTILIVTIVLAAGMAIAVPIAVRHFSKPDFSKMNPRQIREYFDSNQFRDANEDTRRQMGEQIGEAMRARMESEVKGYFALAEENRTAYLDKIIDERQARMAEFFAGRDANRPPGFGPPDANGPLPDANGPPRFGPPGAGGQPGFGPRGADTATGQRTRQRPRPNPERMRARSERISADTRVQMMQFRRAMRERMQERGIQGPMMGPGGRGGFGGPGGGGPGGPPD
jgi:hypothetical protein